MTIQHEPSCVLESDYRTKIKSYLEKYIRRTNPEELRALQSPARTFGQRFQSRFEHVNEVLAEVNLKQIAYHDRQIRRGFGASEGRMKLVCQRTIDTLGRDLL